MKKLILRFLLAIDILLTPFVFISGWLLKLIRRAGVQNMPACRSVLLKVGVFPIRNHYYEPQFDHRIARQALSQDRSLPGIDWNIAEQLTILDSLLLSHELVNLPQKSGGTLEFHFNNRAFESGDAEYWYQLIRMVKPKRIFEVGSGHSTLMARKALRANEGQYPGYSCKHICIEPFETPWLEETGVSVIRKKIEDMESAFFSELEENDILFIDSSHIIRPQGDVLFEYLELLPSLKNGVIVHVHDIFSPKNYPQQWIENEVKFWNEQYLLEAFLSNNSCWKIIGALNYLHHNHYDRLKLIAPYLEPTNEPGSFYIQKIS